MTTKVKVVGALAALTAMALVPGVVDAGTTDGDDDDGDPRLLGRAVLPAETLADGPPAGAFFGDTTINGVKFPRPQQPVAGFSGVVEGRWPGEYLAMPDNGFGNQANSRDFLIRAYYIEPDFKTARGGSGRVDVDDFIQFRDPHDLLEFDIVNEGTTDRLLTGADIDPESLQRDSDGDLWVGEEFGPWILHFDADGVLLDPPFPIPDVFAMTNPFFSGQTPTLGNSRGFEGMAISGKHLYGVLEGAVVGDPPDSRRVYEFDTRHAELTARTWRYRTEQPGHFVADVQALDQRHLAIIERDGTRGAAAINGFRRVYVVDLNRVDDDGYLVKHELLDLTRIPDPDGVSLPAIHPGDVGLGDPFSVVCESVEVLRPVDDERLLVGCDNNLPNLGRNPVVADDNELIVVNVADL